MSHVPVIALYGFDSTLLPPSCANYRTCKSPSSTRPSRPCRRGYDTEHEVIAAVASLWSLHVARCQNRRHLIASQFMVTVGLEESDRLYEFGEALLVLFKAKLEARMWSAFGILLPPGVGSVLLMRPTIALGITG